MNGAMFHRQPKRNALVRRQRRGVAAIELAFMLLFLLIPLTFGVYEFGRAISQYNTIAKSVRDAARYLSFRTPGTGATEASCLVRFGNTTCTGDLLVPGLNAAGVTVAICHRDNCPDTHLTISTGSGVLNFVTVTVSGFSYQSTFLNLVLPNSASNLVAFSPISATFAQPV